MNTTVFSENMRKYRSAKKYTQEEVAEKLCVTSQTVSRWECGTTLPDVMMLPEIAKLYGIIVDDLFKQQSVAYDNYAQRLSALYEISRDPEDFLRCRLEYQKIIKSGKMSLYDKWDYGWLHKAMMNYCKKEALKWFDEVLSHKTQKDTLPYRRAASMKQELLFSIGKGEEVLAEQQKKAKNAADEREWILLIEAYNLSKQYENALKSFSEAIKKYPNNWELYCCAGQTYINMEQYDTAIDYFKKAEKIGTCFCDEKYSLALCYKKLGNTEKAYDIYMEIADIHQKNGYDVEAQQALMYAKELKPITN